MEGYSYEQTIIPVRARQRISVADSCYAYKGGSVRVRKGQAHKEHIGMGRVFYGAFVALLALIISLGSSGSVFLASAFEPDIVEGHIVNVVAKIEMPFQEEAKEEQIVLNEILPNPEGSDSQDGLAGEWVELYNLGSSEADLAGWYIKDAAGNTKGISLANTHTGDTLIGANGSGSEWLVVFMNAAVLNNTGDMVSLYDSADILKDSHTFGDSDTDEDDDSNTSEGGDNDTPTGSETAGNEGKSIARIPDGTGAWIDPVPTPGGPNQLEEVEPLMLDPVELIVETVPRIIGGGGAVGSIAGPDVEAQTETPVETPADLSADEVETPAEIPTEIPTETPAETPEETTEETPVETPAETPVETPVETEQLAEEPTTTEEPAVVPESPTEAEPAVVPEETPAPPAGGEETPAMIEETSAETPA